MTPNKLVVIFLKFEQCGLTICSRDADGITNSEDSDQTAS